jgi:hypothetical protein
MIVAEMKVPRVPGLERIAGATMTAGKAYCLVRSVSRHRFIFGGLIGFATREESNKKRAAHRGAPLC